MPILKVSKECLEYLKSTLQADQDERGSPFPAIDLAAMQVEVDPDLPWPGKDGAMVHAYQHPTRGEMVELLNKVMPIFPGF